MARHHFHLQASWPGLRNDVGTIACEQLKQRFRFQRKWTVQVLEPIQMRCS